VCCRELSTGRKAAYERPAILSSLPLAEEISARLAQSNLVVKTETETRPATLQDLRDALAPFNLDVTTVNAVDWGTEYPHAAEDINRICELEQQLAELRARDTEPAPSPELRLVTQ